MAYEKNIEYETNIKEDIFFNMDKEDLKHISSTLIDNAIKHTASGSKIKINLIKEKGIIILLTARPETIINRIKNDRTRPLIGENMDLDYIRELMASREKIYRNVADLVINTDDRAIDDICKEIVESLGFTL